MSATLPDPRRWQALAVLGVAYLMVVLDVSIVNVALPSIQRSLHFSTSGLEWVVSGYSLTFGGFLLLGGRSGDLLGRRRVFMAGLVLFSIFSLLSGLSTSPAQLVAMRALQGAAGAVLAPSVFSIVSVTFEEGSERNTALGILGAIAGSGAAIGLLFGGVLTEFVGWQWIFFVNVPIGLGVLLVVPRVVRESRARELARHFDIAGAVATTAGLMLLVYGLTRAPRIGWGSAETIGSFVGFAVLIGGAVAIESRSRWPLIDLRIFRRRTLTGANVIGLALGTVVFGTFFLLTLYQQDVLGFSPLRSGVNSLAIALTVIVASAVSQALVTRIGVKLVLSFGLLMLCAGLAYFTQIPVDGTYLTDLFPGFLVIGVGLGFSFVPTSIAALTGVTGREAGLASGLINTSQQIGGALGLAILTTVSTTRTTGLLARHVSTPAALTDGFRLAFWVGVGIAAFAVCLTLVLLRRVELQAVSGYPVSGVAVGGADDPDVLLDHGSGDSAIERTRMPRVSVGTENDNPIELYYEDHGSGQPVVLIHGYPLNSDSWERQERALLDAGYRVIRYDRRGFGNSSRPTTGYDYDTFAADLNALLGHLGLDEVVLAGFSMGSGEVTRYLGTYGSARVSRAVLLGAIPPFLLKTDDNPEGVDGQVFEGIKAAVLKDRYAYFKDFFDNFYNVDKLAPERISEQAWQASFNVAAGASPYASYACVDTWLTDFRADLAKIDVPVLVLHGTEDRILPFEATAKRLPALVANLKLIPVEGGPHNIGWTHPEECNTALLEFLGDGVATATRAA